MKTLIEKIRECDGEFCDNVLHAILIVGTMAVMIHTLMGLQTVI